MKPLVKPTRFSVRHSTVLDELVTHNSGHVRVAAAVFVTAMKPPAHASRLNLSLERLLLGFDLFEKSEPVLAGVIDYSRRSVRLLQETVTAESLSKDETERPIDLKQNPVYGTLHDIPADDLRSLEALAAAYVRCQFDGGSINAAFARSVHRNARSPLSSDIESAESRKWHEAHKRNVAALKKRAQGTTGEGDDDFQRAATSCFIWRSKLPGKNARHGLVDDRCLTEDAFARATKTLRIGLIDGTGLAAAVSAGFLSGLTWDLSKRIPLMSPAQSEGWAIWLDLENGCYWNDLNRVVRNAAEAKGNTNYISATKRFPRYLPYDLLRALRNLAVIRPEATCLGELTDTSAIPPEYSIDESDHVLKPSIARFFNSRSSVSRRLGMSGSIAALAIGEFARVVHSKFYYHTTTSHQLNEALDKLACLLGWGPIRHGAELTESIGAEVVPRSDTIARIARELAERVEAATPPRSYKWHHIRRFHNAVADYTAFLVSLGVMGRSRDAVVLLGARHVGRTHMAGMHDKKTLTSKGSTPVAICSQVREQLAHWFKHLENLIARLDRLGLQAQGLRHRVESILDGSTPSIVFKITEADRPESCGSTSAYGGLEEDLRIKADSARHFWESFFDEADVPDEIADAQARRTVHWSKYWHMTSTLRGARVRDVINTIQERVLRDLGIKPMKGLVK